MIRVVIVDDEAMARAKLRRLLDAHADVELVGEGQDMKSGLRAVSVGRPDVLFLDVDMPGGDGITLARALPDPPPQLVFATAYSEFAVQAFELEALDYLLKPFDAGRLDRVLDRVRSRLSGPDRPTLARLEALLGRLEAPQGTEARPFDHWARRVLVEQGGEMRFVRIEDVLWLASADNYVELHARDGVHLVRDTLAEVERRLDPSRFLRVHRTAIVQLDRITAIRARATGGYEITIEDGTILPVGRTHQESLLRRWHGGGDAGAR